ncbi:hypothetical protein DKX38_026173 [Salix brachista]|uniref:Retroviral polymerase SH3-like domain-containing protein n=1 Tax=Salix brachista TaxID=2182728 RepID=A0A5N5JUM0_9ROSI|nr:hypothetical protein DKX38_026173 [Salix brachista]
MSFPLSAYSLLDLLVMVCFDYLPNSFWGEALNTSVHVLNLTPCVPLQFDVPDRVWNGKDVSYDHLRVFGCKAFVYILKDERSKLDVKTRQCIFLGYGLDEFGYRLYDPVEKKLVRSRDVVFMEDQTIHDIEKTEKVVPRYSDCLIDLDPSSLIDLPTQVEHDVQNDFQVPDDIDVPLQDESHDQLPVPEIPSDVPPRRSTRDRHPSTRYSVNESKHIDVRYHWIRDTLNDKLLTLEKIHTDDNGSDMLTKALTREKLETCCSIAGMANPST